MPSAHRAVRRRSRLGRSEALVIYLARNAGDGPAGSGTCVVAMELVCQLVISGHRAGVLLVYENLKSKPHGEVERVTAEREWVPAMNYDAIGEVQVDIALAIDHLNTHCANRARCSLQQRLVSLRNVHSRPLRQSIGPGVAPSSTGYGQGPYCAGEPDPRPASRVWTCRPARHHAFVPQGITHLYQRVPLLLEQAEEELPGVFRQLVQRLLEHLKILDRQVNEMEIQIQMWHRSNPLSRKLEKIPGAGPLTASAMVASVGDAKSFNNGRQSEPYRLGRDEWGHSDLPSGQPPK